MSRKKKREAWGENGFEEWGGYMAAKQAKLEEQFHCEADNEVKTSTIFEGIAIFVNGYTDPTADELRRLMMMHGGTYHHYMRPRATTHIIASNLPYSKIIQYRKSQNPIPICKPEWIVNSIKSGRLLNFQKYLLYSHCTSTQPQLNYIIKDKVKETNATIQLLDSVPRYNQLDPPGSDNPDKREANSSYPTLPISSRDAHSTKNSEFISEFYSHSRLHHIATMGATFKDYVNELRDKSNGNFPGLVKLKELRDMKLDPSLSDSQIGFDIETDDLQGGSKGVANQKPVIMHIDMDCFFVSVGLRDKPQLRGLPVAVTHAKGNKKPAGGSKQSSDSNTNEDGEHGSLSEVASCSYEARKAGVKNGMFLGEALKICPNLKTMPYDFDGYTDVSYILYDTVASYTLDIEAVSCDEMYADCTKILAESCLSPLEFASIIREEIKTKTGCPVSTGFGSNKLLARLATKKAKPDGQYLIQRENCNNYIAALGVKDLPGVGWTTAQKLKTINVQTCAELQAVPLATLQKEFGKKTSEVLYNMCRGIDNSKLNLEHVRKSVSAEVNYGIRFESNEDAIDFLQKLSREVSNRLHKANAKGRSITLKVLVRSKDAPKETEKFMGHGMCDYMTKSKNLIAAVNDADIITKEVITLWNQMQKVPEDARGIGIQISRLEILKHKSRDTTLMSFVKNKPSNASNNSSETEPAANENTATVTSNIAAEDERKTDVPSEINGPVISELPEDIRNEILNGGKLSRENVNDQENADVQRTEENKSRKNTQTHQEHFFKATKSGLSRPTKVEMPSLQEIDMSVLIELPEDIRNEILNEYKSKKNENESSAPRNRNPLPRSTEPTTSTEANPDAQNISLSQVDPEFLSALPDDVRQEVEIYCGGRRTANSVQTKKPQVNLGSLMGESSRQGKRMELNSRAKNTAKNGKANAKGKRKIVQGASKKIVKVANDAPNALEKRIGVEAEKSIVTRITGTESLGGQVTAEETEAILSHRRTISENDGGANQHQDILIDLVNRLLSLPLEQVRRQMEMWISNSKVVNEVDFLSLATFLSMLPEKRRIEDLHVLLKTMHRCMTKTGNCIWHRTYRKTVKYVQHYMQIEYNSNLMVPPVKCNLMRCNSDVM